MNTTHSTIFCGLLILCITSACGVGHATLLTDAENFRAEKKYDEAINAYREHMESRLQSENRESWENPYFYELLIGDVALEKGDLVAAKAAYLEAESQHIEDSLFLDRMRQLAKKYEENRQFKEALDLLKPYQTRDELLINADLDRYARELVESSQTTEPAK